MRATKFPVEMNPIHLTNNYLKDLTHENKLK